MADAPPTVTPAASSRTVAIVLAAGASTRFGSPKQLALLGGIPLLERVLRTLETVAIVDETIVVLGAHAEQIRAALRPGDATLETCDTWAEGPSASLRTGLHAALRRGATTVVITVGDQPGLRPEAIVRVAAQAHPAARATYDGRPGHPVVLRNDAIAQILDAPDTVSRRALLRQVATPVAVGDLGGGDDIDTPADLARATETL